VLLERGKSPPRAGTCGAHASLVSLPIHPNPISFFSFDFGCLKFNYFTSMEFYFSCQSKH